MSGQGSLSAFTLPRDPVAPLEASTKQYVDARVGNYTGAPGWDMLRDAKPHRPLGLDGEHSAFPGAVLLPTGELLLAWRQGADHFTSRDGEIRTSRSADLGRTWSNPVVAVAYPGGGVDLRDPSLSVSADGQRVYLTYFKGTAANPGIGAFVRASTDSGVTWGAEVRIDSLGTGVIAAPLVELANGTLVAFLYGRVNTGDARDSLFTATSTTNGATWTTQTLIANGVTDGRDYQEPWAVRRGSTVLVLFRYGNNDGIGRMVSTNGSATSWSAITRVFTGTGRPNFAWLATGWLVCLYRTSAGVLEMRKSADVGVTWWAPQVLRYPPKGGMSTYAAPIEVNPSELFVPLSEESAGAVISRHYLTYVVHGGGDTPLGVVPGSYAAIATEYDKIQFATTFDQANGGLGSPWNVFAGGLTVTDGVVASTVADNTPDRAVVHVGNSEQDIYSEMSWTGGPGVGVIFRWVDASTYLIFTVETGLNARLYKSTAFGSPLATVAYSPDQWNAFMRFHVWTYGNTIVCKINDAVVIRHSLTSGDQTQFGGANGLGAGFSLNSDSGTSRVHRCRRFIAKVA